LDTKIFVGQLPPQSTTDTLREVFGPYGQIVEATLLWDSKTGSHKGCGFVNFSTAEQAQAAIEGTNEKITLPGAKRSLIVKATVEKSQLAAAGNPAPPVEWKLYVGMLSRESSEEEIRTIFESYGRVDEVVLIKDRETGQSKGTAFVKFATREEALRAINALNDSYRDKKSPGNLQVRFAHTKLEKDKIEQSKQMSLLGSMSGISSAQMLAQQQLFGSPNFGGNPGFGGNLAYGGSSNSFGGLPFAQQQAPAYGGSQFATTMPGLSGLGSGLPLMSSGLNLQANPSLGFGNDQKGPPNSNLFVYNLPDIASERDLLSMFSAYGNVISCRIMRDKVTNQPKGFGFVSYDSPHPAQQAIQSLNGTMLGGKRLDVRIKNENR